MTGQDAIKLNAKQQAAKAASRLARPCERFYYWITHGEIAAALLAMGLWTAAGALFYCLDKSWLTDEAEQVSLSLSVSLCVCVCVCVLHLSLPHSYHPEKWPLRRAAWLHSDRCVLLRGDHIHDRRIWRRVAFQSACGSLSSLPFICSRKTETSSCTGTAARSDLSADHHSLLLQSRWCDPQPFRPPHSHRLSSRRCVFRGTDLGTDLGTGHWQGRWRRSPSKQARPTQSCRSKVSLGRSSTLRSCVCSAWWESHPVSTAPHWGLSLFARPLM